MNILHTIRDWMYRLQERSGDRPDFMPLSREEILEVMSDAHISRGQVLPPICPLMHATDELYMRGKSSVFGIDVFETPFAAEMRTRQITLPMGMIDEYATLFEPDFEIKEYREKFIKMVTVKVARRICHDTTQIKVTLEWDSLAKLKRRLRLTRWFPVRTRTVQIEGRILYPYLKISLPHNRHHVQFFVK